MMPDSPRKTVLVTGAAVRLGAAISLRLAREGWQVVLHHGRSREAAHALAERIRATGGHAVPLQADLTRAGEAERLFQQAREALGPITALVNNAAMFPDEDRFGGMGDAQRDRLLQLNLWSPLALCRALAAQAELENGAVVNLLDARLQQPGSDHFHYRLAKGALAQATRMLAGELAPRIRVNGIGPGAILPPPGKNDDWLMQQKQGRIPLERTGRPDDIAEAVAWLLQAPFVTGQILAVDGGEFLSC